MGFEPMMPFWSIHTFQACAFDHSATSPYYLLAKILTIYSMNVRIAKLAKRFVNCQGGDN